MATEEEAHKAREEHSGFLRNSGAHAIAVDKINAGDTESFGVIAYYETQPSEHIPDSLEIVHDGNKKTVPLAAIITSRAALE